MREEIGVPNKHGNSPSLTIWKQTSIFSKLPVDWTRTGMIATQYIPNGIPPADTCEFDLWVGHDSDFQATTNRNKQHQDMRLDPHHNPNVQTVGVTPSKTPTEKTPACARFDRVDS
jgi:hypothetical protein